MKSVWAKKVSGLLRPSQYKKASCVEMVNSGKMWEVTGRDGKCRYYWRNVQTDSAVRSASDLYRVPVKIH